jgi:uncharacterized protein (TIGR02996 family)
MKDEAFLKAITSTPSDDAPRLIYADWLDERNDPRAPLLRVHVMLRALPPDHPNRAALEQELSILRKGLDTRWLAIVEPERAHVYVNPPTRPVCNCLEIGYKKRRRPQPRFHQEPQDTECSAWKRLLQLFDDAAADGRTEFAPLRDMSPEERAQIVTLPPTIARLKAVRHLLLYGSDLVRLPAEIGEMTSLERFTPYTSYRLHWFPYEITRCLNLQDSTVSTRALYGNYKYRLPFPRLGRGAESVGGEGIEVTRLCSVCGKLFVDRQHHRVWISLLVATDVLPLLVNACSAECVARLPVPPDGYVQRSHRGGLELKQPLPEH